MKGFEQESCQRAKAHDVNQLRQGELLADPQEGVDGGNSYALLACRPKPAQLVEDTSDLGKWGAAGHGKTYHFLFNCHEFYASRVAFRLSCWREWADSRSPGRVGDAARAVARSVHCGLPGGATKC